MTPGNRKMSAARAAKNDEFYTQLSDIEKELRHYSGHFRDKTVFLNCDDPTWSMFWVYFQQNFDHLGLRKLISTHYDADRPTYMQTITRSTNLDADGGHGAQDIVTTPLRENGDFRSPECLDLLDEADIVVTNPPFSLFREFVPMVVGRGKGIIVLGNKNAITYKEIWRLIENGELWIGVMNMGQDILFSVPDDVAEEMMSTRKKGSAYRIIDGKVLGRASACWFTNLDHDRRHEEIPLYREYDSVVYPAYANYPAIEVSKVSEIPIGYEGEMGVPITFLGKHNPDQFEIVGYSRNVCSPLRDVRPEANIKGRGSGSFYVEGPHGEFRELYDRIVIRRARP